MTNIPAPFENSIIELLMGIGGSHTDEDQVPRLLLVEDERQMLDSMLRLLGGRGYDVKTATTGGEAIDHLTDHPVDLLLLDLHLPDVNGLEVLNHATVLGLDTCTIVVSGDSNIDAAIRALKQGAYSYIRKAYKPDAFLHSIDNALSHLQYRRDNKRIHHRLAQSEQLYRYLVDESPDLIYMLDDQSRFTFVNRRFQTLLGYNHEDLLGQHYSTIVHPTDQEAADYVFRERRQSGRASRNVELRLHSKLRDGSQPFEASPVTLAFNAFGVYRPDSGQHPRQYIGTYGIARDISERRKVEDLLAFRASHDILTELPNRNLFKARLELATLQAKRNGHIAAVMNVDLDRFKWINDNLGLLAGDEVLRIAAMRINSCLDATSILARMGGDEFTVLIPYTDSLNQVEGIAQRIQQTMGQPCQVGEHEVFLSASIGISVYPDHGATADGLMRNADVAMNQVKVGGKNAYAFFDHSMQSGSHLKITLERELRHAVRVGELVMYYQPQVDSRADRIVGAEALIRWLHPEKGLLPAGNIIPLAEEIGLLSDLSDWILESTLADLHGWLDTGLGPLRLSINVSPTYLEQSDFIDRVLEIVERHGVPAELLELEVTEGLAIRDFENAVTKLGFLANTGMRIVIDDFGMGYSSLSYLQRFPVHSLKIDKGFISEIKSASQRAPLVQMIISVARSLGLDVIAEGVELPEQMKFLLTHGCNIVQGYLYHQPLPATEMVKLLRRQREGEYCVV